MVLVNLGKTLANPQKQSVPISVMMPCDVDMPGPETTSIGSILKLPRRKFEGALWAWLEIFFLGTPHLMHWGFNFLEFWILDLCIVKLLSFGVLDFEVSEFSSFDFGILAYWSIEFFMFCRKAWV